jgi:hypothetical protein
MERMISQFIKKTRKILIGKSLESIQDWLAKNKEKIQPLQSLFLDLKQRFSNNGISHNILKKINFDPVSPHTAVSLGLENKGIPQSPSIFDQNPISNRRVSVYNKSTQDHEVTYLGPDLANNLALEMRHRRRFDFGMLDFFYGAYCCCKRQYGW